jgi:hypothetical protein
MIHDPFENAADSPIAPAERCFAIAPDDNLELPMATKALYVGTGGDVTVRPVRGGEDVAFRNVPDGTILDIRVIAVRAAGTTAADIVGLA